LIVDEVFALPAAVKPTSENDLVTAKGRIPFVLEKTSETSAIPIGLRPPLPLKMTSVISLPRSPLADCSPKIHFRASTTLLLPLPLGPTTPVTPGPKSNRVRSAKLLKPISSSDLSMQSPSDLDPAKKGAGSGVEPT